MSFIFNVKGTDYDLEKYDLSRLNSIDAYLYLLECVDRKSIRTLRELYLKIDVEANTKRLFEYNTFAEKCRNLLKQKLIEANDRKVVDGYDGEKDFQRYIELKLNEPDELTLNEKEIWNTISQQEAEK